MRLIILCLFLGVVVVVVSWYAAMIAGVVLFAIWLQLVSYLGLAAATVLLVIGVARMLFSASDADRRTSEEANRYRQIEQQ